MSEMVKRVARAIYRAERHWVGLEDEWDTFVSGSKDVRLDQARAAIAAMREPTEAMVKEAENDADCNVMLCWETMIDEALR